MNYIRHLNGFFSRIKTDPRLTGNHISLYMALFQYWNYNRFENVFPIYRANIMQLCKIGSRNTYYKCIKELHHAGYIRHHPAINKYLPVKISMRRFDQLDDASDSPQLDLFNIDNPENKRPKIEPLYVPDMSKDSPKSDPLHVPNVGHIIKQVNYKQVNSVLNTHTENLKKNSEEKDTERMPAAGSNPVPQNPPPRQGPYQVGEEGGRVLIPTFSDIELFFQRNGYPPSEAQKFWLYNRSRGWMLSDNAPIWNWQPLAHKWMLNTRQDGSKVSGTSHLNTQNDKNYDEPL